MSLTSWDQHIPAELQGEEATLAACVCDYCVGIGVMHAVWFRCRHVKPVITKQILMKPSEYYHWSITPTFNKRRVLQKLTLLTVKGHSIFRKGAGKIQHLYSIATLLELHQ